VHQRLAGEKTSIVNQELRRKIVDTIDRNVVAPDNLTRVLRCEALLVHDHLNVRVERIDFFFPR